MEVGVRHVKARGEHPDLLRLINGLDDSGHPLNHEHQPDEGFIVQSVKGFVMASGNDKYVTDVDRMFI